jgi:hypothetical protein
MASTIVVDAQGDRPDGLTNLVMPRFEQAVVKLKNGKSYSAVMNYEKTEQQMIILRNGQYFLFKDQQSVDTILIGDRTFVPAETGFLEVLVNAPVSLYLQHKANLESEGSTVAYGSKSTTAGITHITTIYGKEGAIVLKIPENYKVIDASSLWISKAGVLTNVSNKKQFLKLFEDRSGDLSLFIKENDTNFGNADDMTRLVMYCNELNK